MRNAEHPEKELTGTQSVDRALRLLSLIGRQPRHGMTLADAVEQGGFNRPTTRRLLMALMRAGYVEQDQDSRRYFIGQEAFLLGSFASQRYGLLQMSMDSLTRLARKTEDSCFLSIRRHYTAVCLHREEGSFPVRTHALQAGFEHPLGVGAGSLAMLATLPDAEVNAALEANAAILASTYPDMTPDVIRRDVRMTRMQGFALNPGRIYANSWGVGVALKASDGQLAGALSIAAIDSRLPPKRQAELAQLLRDEAARIEDRLAHMFDNRADPAIPLQTGAPKSKPRGRPATRTATVRRSGS